LEDGNVQPHLRILHWVITLQQLSLPRHSEQTDYTNNGGDHLKGISAVYPNFFCIFTR
jgi:hypothetical protein